MTLKDALNNMVTERCNGGLCDMENAAEYTESINKYCQLFTSLISHLKEEEKEILLEMDSLNGTIAALATDSAYKLGLKDGIELKQILGLVS